MTTGRTASRSSAAARSTAAPSASSARGDGGGSGAGSAASPNTWSSGRSTKAGPECGASAVRQAASTSSGISAVEPAVAASLTSGRTNGTWSISCSDPCPHRHAGARPPRTTIGEWLCWAAPSALMPLVTPGPAVSAHTPGVRVTLAHPSAANAAEASCRVSTMSMPSARHPS